MNQRFYLVICFVVMLISAPLAAFAQDAPPDNTPQPTPVAEPVFSAAQIDQALAPIALYPDQLVSQILTASTYPLEIVEAHRWLQNQQNAALQGDQLTAALDQQRWDPSVKSLVPFPQILAMMDANLPWTEQLGDAFLAQQGAVMDSIQRLRHDAQVAGNLTSNQQQTVVSSGSVIEIVPAQPQVVYVPYYNPVVVYGDWPYPSYQPYYFTGYAGYPNGFYATFGTVSFGFGIGIYQHYWGWNHWDWRNHRLDIDNDRYTALNRGVPPIHAGIWSYDPAHRHGVPFTNAAVRAQFHGDAYRSNFRGYAASPNQAAATGHPLGLQNRQGVVTHTGYNARQQSAPSAQTHAVAMPNRTASAPAFHNQSQQPAAAQTRSASVFESFARGNEVRSQSQRGAHSLSSMSQGAGVARPAANSGAGHGGNTQHGASNRR